MRLMKNHSALRFAAFALLAAFGLLSPSPAEAGIKAGEWFRNVERQYGQKFVTRPAYCCSSLIRKYKSGRSAFRQQNVTGEAVGDFFEVDEDKNMKKGFRWNRQHPTLELVVMVGAADSNGVYISGLQAGDQVEVLAATGKAYFSDNKIKRAIVTGIVGVVTTAGSAYKPELKPVLDEARKQASEINEAVFPKQAVSRDGTGKIKPGEWGRKEGGVLICMPRANGTRTASDGYLKRGKEPRYRFDNSGKLNYPVGFENCFFFVSEDRPGRRGSAAAHNQSIVQQSGPMFVMAWDHIWHDNSGVYEVHMRITRRDAVEAKPLPPVFGRRPTGVLQRPLKLVPATGRR